MGNIDSMTVRVIIHRRSPLQSSPILPHRFPLNFSQAAGHISFSVHTPYTLD